MANSKSACAGPQHQWCARAAITALALCVSIAAANATPPPIRTTKDNAVPRCVTSARLMAFLKQRNHNLDPRFVGIADWYRRHGEKWHVRWDYAFYQMAVETNFLTYKQGNGRWGDVRPSQNNFAGLGTTGGGVPGDSYPDVSTGVLAQIQHLVVYSGEHIPAPVGARTKLKQDDIIESVASFDHPATFQDLSRRWASDRHYGASIEWVADSYRSAFCSKADEALAPRLVVKPRSASAAKKRVAEAELPPAAALGGPADSAADNAPAAAAADVIPEPVVEPVADSRSSNAMPVRTVWSRSTDATGGADPQSTQSLPSSAATARVPDEDGPPVQLANKHVTAAKPVSHTAEAPHVAAAKVAEPAIPQPAATEPEQKVAAKDAGEDKLSTPQVAEPAAAAAIAETEQKAPEPELKLAEPKAPSAPATDPPGSPTPASSQSAPAAPADAKPAPTEPSAAPPPAAPVAPPAPRELAQAPDATPAAAPEAAKDTSFKYAAAMDVGALTAPPAPEQVAAAKLCRIMSASYGGKKTILVLARQDGEARYTALTVLDGFERSMLDNFVKLHAPGGASIGEFATREAALTKAKQMCRGSARGTARAG